MLFQKVRFLGHPVSNLNSNQRNDLVCYIAQNFLYRIVHQTGDKPESDVTTEENGLLQKELKFEFNIVFVKL